VLPLYFKTLRCYFGLSEGKPVGIHQFIGRRPIACFGNSDGDQAMLEYTTIGNPHPSFGMIVRHTGRPRIRLRCPSKEWRKADNGTRGRTEMGLGGGGYETRLETNMERPNPMTPETNGKHNRW